MKANLTGILFLAAAFSTTSTLIAQGAPPPQLPQPPPQGQQQGQHPAIRNHHRHPHPEDQNRNPLQPRFGDPLPGLTAAQMAAFIDGRDDFENAETPAGGLGPIFNRDSCVACHNGPAVGGSSPIFVTRFGSFINGVFDPLADLGGSLLQERAIVPQAREIVPPLANVVAHRESTPLFGLGLMEAIPDATILAGVKAAPVDGVKGKAAMITDVVSGNQRVGRFGWKAQQATVLAFAADAYRNEMGITNRFFPTENAPNGNLTLLAQFDKVADPEDTVDPATGKTDVDKVADFMQLLGPPPALPLSPSAAQGRNVFNQVSCNLCHTPSMMTGANAVPALNFKVVNLFSDLLLHDMGSLGDGIEQGPAGTREMKTAPLWGLRASPPYLHDGRAPTVDAAIRGHDGEAKGSRDRYNALSPTARQQLIDFLLTL